jgi:hypothetical protein
VGIELITERHAAQIEGVLGCWDRMLVFGTLPKICYAEGTTSYLYANHVRIFDYPRFADPFRNQLRENAERLAAANGIEYTLGPVSLKLYDKFGLILRIETARRQRVGSRASPVAVAPVFLTIRPTNSSGSMTGSG